MVNFRTILPSAFFHEQILMNLTTNANIMKTQSFLWNKTWTIFINLIGSNFIKTYKNNSISISILCKCTFFMNIERSKKPLYVLITFDLDCCSYGQLLFLFLIQIYLPRKVFFSTLSCSNIMTNLYTFLKYYTSILLQEYVNTYNL